MRHELRRALIWAVGAAVLGALALAIVLGWTFADSTTVSSTRDLRDVPFGRPFRFAWSDQSTFGGVTPFPHEESFDPWENPTDFDDAGLFASWAVVTAALAAAALAVRAYRARKR